MKYRCQACKGNRIVEAVEITEETFTSSDRIAGVEYEPDRKVAKVAEGDWWIIGRIGDWIITDADGSASIVKGPNFPLQFQPET